jgi:hypothetical protein
MNKLLNQQLAEVLTGAGFRAKSGLKCEGVLRVGAGTLCRAAPGEITATTVVCDLQGAAVDTFEWLVQDIADEYGLDAGIQQQRTGSYSVRFTCPRPPELPVDSLGKPIGNFLLTLCNAVRNAGVVVLIHRREGVLGKCLISCSS